MFKKLLSPICVGTFILVLVIGSLAHLMYGDCQSSKWHYIVQQYYMRNYLPRWMCSKDSPGDRLERLFWSDEKSTFTGTKRAWYKNGNQMLVWQIRNGSFVGEFVRRYENDKIQIIRQYDDSGKNYFEEYWSESGYLISAGDYFLAGYACGFPNYRRKNIHIFWSENGSLSKKEYYDSKGNFQKKEIFENDTLVKTEGKK